MRAAAATDPGQVLRLLAEPTRLRILALLEREELSVGELSRALGMAQSRVSNHLRLLRDAGCLGERHAGTSTFVQLALGQGAAGEGDLTGRLWREVRGELSQLPEHAADLVRLEDVLGARADAGFFDRHAEAWDKIAGGFESDLGRERAIAHLVPPELVVADLGCGTGYMAQALLGRVARLVCVDRSEPMLAEAKARLARAARGRPGTAVELRLGTFEALPLSDAECNAALLGLVLHHLPELDQPLQEVRRALKPGGTAVALELAPHKETWMLSALGDRHPGLEPAYVADAFRRAGFDDVVLEPVDDHYRPERPDDAGGGRADLELYLVRGRRPRVRMTSSNARTNR